MTNVIPSLPEQPGVSAPPTTEIGYPSMMPMKWSMWVTDMEEETPDLRWPNSVRVYHKMRTDSQIHALLNAIFLPIRRSRWVIDPNNARDEVVETVASDLGLPIRGVDDPPPRARMRFNHDDHLRHALLGLIYGFMFFEQVGTIEPDPLQWRLRKLAPRMPQSINNMDVAQDGGLLAIRQWPMVGQDPMGLAIPVNRLAGYIWDKEGANWLGRSILRGCFRHWLLKDRLIRVDAMKHERFGIGVPKATAPPGATRDVISRYAAMAQAIRADYNSGVGVPTGSDVSIEGIKGSLPDTLASIQYHDEAMARNFLAMFLELGQTKHGSRALGESFVDFFKMGVDAVSSWYADITNKFVVEDMVDWNWGPDEIAPQVTWDEDPESRLNAVDLVALINAGAIVVDEELRSWITDRWGVSDPGPNTPIPTGPPGAPGAPGAPVTAPPGTVPRVVPLTITPSGTKPKVPPTVPAAAARRRNSRLRGLNDWDSSLIG